MNLVQQKKSLVILLCYLLVILFAGTDGGLEFNGDQLPNLDQQGVIKRIGNSYDHHYSGKAVNSNTIITGMARAILLAFKLPESYYGEALMTRCYLFKRLSEIGSMKRSLE